MSKTGTQPIAPIAIDAKGVAGLFPFSVRSWRRLDSAGRCPRGYRVSGHKVWRVRELQEWAAAGFPTRAEWEARK